MVIDLLLSPRSQANTGKIPAPADGRSNILLTANPTYDNLGLQNSQSLGPILNGIIRNPPEGRGLVNIADREGIAGATGQRDGPFGA
jgi:enoyl-CoA hydratase